jgi:hypothetical protein
MAYSENNPDHVPNPFHQTGSVKTTETAGEATHQIDLVSPIFAEARASAVFAAAASEDASEETQKLGRYVEQHPVSELAPHERVGFPRPSDAEEFAESDQSKKSDTEKTTEEGTEKGAKPATEKATTATHRKGSHPHSDES